MPQVRAIGVLVTPANRPPGDCCTGPGVSPDLVIRWLQTPLDDGKENLEAGCVYFGNLRSERSQASRREQDLAQGGAQPLHSTLQ